MAIMEPAPSIQWPGHKIIRTLGLMAAVRLLRFWGWAMGLGGVASEIMIFHMYIYI